MAGIGYRNQEAECLARDICGMQIVSKFRWCVSKLVCARLFLCSLSELLLKRVMIVGFVDMDMSNRGGHSVVV